MDIPEQKTIQDSYLVQTLLYSGPLDLLLDLIERAELDITKLALAQVTDQYLEYLAFLENRDPDEISSFLVIASRLVQIKSASLLPTPFLSHSPSDMEDDPGEALAQQLLVYKRFKEISKLLKERDERGMRSYLRITPPPAIIISKFDLSGLGLEDLLQAARDVFQYKTPLPSLSEVVSIPRITIRQKIHTILRKIQHSSGMITFKGILQNHSRMEFVVTFLAILELIKRNVIDAQQSTRFGDIQLLMVGQWSENFESEIEFKD